MRAMTYPGRLLPAATLLVTASCGEAPVAPRTAIQVYSPAEKTLRPYERKVLPLDEQVIYVVDTAAPDYDGSAFLLWGPGAHRRMLGDWLGEGERAQGVVGTPERMVLVPTTVSPLQMPTELPDDVKLGPGCTYHCLVSGYGIASCWLACGGLVRDRYGRQDSMFWWRWFGPELWDGDGLTDPPADAPYAASWDPQDGAGSGPDDGPGLGGSRGGGTSGGGSSGSSGGSGSSSGSSGSSGSAAGSGPGSGGPGNAPVNPGYY